MKIFGQYELSNALDKQIDTLRKEVRAENKNELLNANEAEYINYLVSKYQVAPVEFKLDDKYVSSREENIPSEMFPQDFFSRPGNSYSRTVITYHIPFEGDPDLLKMAPSSRLLWSAEVKTADQEVLFEIINFRNDPEQIKKEASSIISNIVQQGGMVNEDLDRYNDGLERVATEIVQARKKEIFIESDLLSSLGVPIEKVSDLPDTFSVPVQKKKPLITKPSSSIEPFHPEPILDDKTYSEILGICHDLGVEVERHPSLYKGKGEEDLRDYFIMALSPHFQSVSGETFNKSGKTDILIRHNRSNIFIAECKIWKGAKAHNSTINQALSYLTWRDSKAAIFYFVQNKEFGSVLAQIEATTLEHDCFVKEGKKVNDAWFSYKFHLVGDSTRGVDLAIQCFHFPKQ